MNLVLFGPPGAGKGTQSQLLCDRYKLRHLSTGDAIRAAIRSGSPLGREVKARVEGGHLIDDDQVSEMVREILRQWRSETDTFLFDGYPRTLRQVEHLEELCAEFGLTSPAVVSLDVPEDILMRRITGRRICLECKKIFNVYFNPPRREDGCDANACPLMQRPDDTPETVSERLRVYHNQTAPVLQHYEMRGRLAAIDGAGETEEVFERICAILAEHY